MGTEDESFFKENIITINRKFNAYLFWMMLIPIALFALTKAGIFKIPDWISISIFGYTVFAFTTDFILVRKHSFEAQKVAMYFGLFAVETFVAIMGCAKDIGIYLTYGLVAFLSCLYYNKKLTNIVSITGYFFMLGSMYIKWTNSAVVFNRAVNHGFVASYVPVLAGMTIEFIFIVLATNMHTTRNYKTLQQLVISNYHGKATLDALRTKIGELHETQFHIIEFVAKCLGSHDLFTGTHVVHTQTYVKIIATRLRANGFYKDELTDENIALFQKAAFLHDIGKLHIPEGVLNKIGRFTDEERKLMNSHPEEGKKLLESLPVIEKGKFNEIAIQMAWCHHEKWNGTGYPRGIKGEEIPLCARIMAAADVMDALISQRLYKDPMTIDQAIKVFEESSGTHFEPCIAQATIDSRAEIAFEDKKYKDTEKVKYAKELEWWKDYHKQVDHPQN